MTGKLEFFPKLAVTPISAGFTHQWAHEVEPSPTAWLVKGLIPTKGYGFIYGASGAGKSFYSIDMGMRIAAGLEVHDRRTKPAGVIYIAAEGAEGVRKRLKAWRLENALTVEVPFAFVPEAPRLGSRLVGGEVERGFDALVGKLDDIVADMKSRGQDVGLIVVDTLASAMAGLDENSAGEASAVAADLLEISRRFDCFTLAVHHSGVTTNERMRGSSAFNAGGDLTIQVVRESTEGPRVVTYQKVRDDEDGHRFAFRLKGVMLGTDADGEPVTSAVPIFEEPPEPKAKGRRPPTAGQQLILRALSLCLDDGLGASVIGPGVRAGTLGVDRKAIKQRALDIGYADGDEKNARTNLNRDLRALIERELIRQDGMLISAVSA